MIIKTVRDRKQTNDANANNTYLIRLKNSKDNLCDWYPDELCFVREVSENHVIIFRAFDGKEYKLTEKEVKNFKLI